MIPETTGRVNRNTAETLNEAIRRQTEQSIAYHAAGGPEVIERRSGKGSGRR